MTARNETVETTRETVLHNCEKGKPACDGMSSER
jgi:hypothetical protein